MTRAPDCILALDQGGHASRALVFDPHGHVLASAERRVPTRRRGNDQVEHAPAAVLRSLREAAQAALAALPRRGAEVNCAALATQRSSIVCWNRNSGEALSPVLSWQDRRAARQVSALAAQTPRVRVLTGLVLSPHYGASKIAWCLRHLPAVQRAAERGRLAAGPLAAFLLANLLQERPCITDPVNGARTQLMDLANGDWSPELCRLFGIPPQILPACVPNRHGFGHLHLAGRGIPLSVVTGDQPAALFALGTPEAGTAYVNIGTGAFAQCLSERDAPGLLRSLVWRDAEHELYALEGTVNGAASALEAMAAKLGLPSRRAMGQLPAWLNAGTPLLFLNGIGGLGAPYWRSRFRSRFIGRGDAGEKMAAVLESVAFLLLANLERMRRAGVRIGRIRASGGLAQLDGLCQRLADLSGLAVKRPALHEATALGLANLCGGLATAAPSGASFEPRANPALRARHRHWLHAMREALRQD